jgi:hypothetical protein
MAIFRFLNEGKRKDAWAVSRAHQYFVLNLFKVRKSEVGSQKSEVRSPKSERTSAIYKSDIAHCELSTANFPLKGMYKGSIIWEFFVKKKKYFTDLDQADFH